MKVAEQQIAELRRSHAGIWITEACDKCGQLLGSVRWTRRGERGEWCSKSCRDGIAAGVPESSSKGCLECGARLDGKRADAAFCSRTHMMRYRRRELSRTGPKHEIIGNRPIEKQGLTEAQNESWTDSLTRPRLKPREKRLLAGVIAGPDNHAGRQGCRLCRQVSGLNQGTSC